MVKYDKGIVFHFERGAYFAGTLEYKIEKVENRFIFKGRAFNDFYWMDNVEFILPEAEVVKLCEILSPIKSWEKEYESKDEILDGYGWGVYFNYVDEVISSGGYEAYPDDYWKVIRKLQKHIEKLGKKYNINYQEQGAKERVKL